MRFLVTAGSSREMIDRVRDWGNIFTGNTGFSIALALADVGEVDLITSNRTHLDGHSNAANMHALAFVSHADLKQQIESCLKQHRYDAVFMTAAVADYLPTGSYQIVRREIHGDGEETWSVRSVHAGKVKSSYDQIAFTGTPTEKLIDLFRTTWRYTGILVKFKLEVGLPQEQLIAIGQASRRASGADYLVANTLEMVSGEKAGAYLLSDAGEEWIARKDLAKKMVRLISPSPRNPGEGRGEGSVS